MEGCADDQLRLGAFDHRGRRAVGQKVLPQVQVPATLTNYLGGVFGFLKPETPPFSLLK